MACYRKLQIRSNVKYSIHTIPPCLKTTICFCCSKNAILKDFINPLVIWVKVSTRTWSEDRRYCGCCYFHVVQSLSSSELTKSNGPISSETLHPRKRWRPPCRTRLQARTHTQLVSITQLWRILLNHCKNRANFCFFFFFFFFPRSHHVCMIWYFIIIWCNSTSYQAR